ncbi:hypothetical protein E1B28_001760 [Marasmius oreades]|uniref:Uncharacterized protein n=1 Tax=Marasmius oreades TaxID=181124 RepID=A0A9P7V4E8_9AGAR|nr:uncharacterized protein E1B28_001760 [Marasmius oreades]KAG7099967.1 hypothetical protein E1B28_001760 [Marasmius oreades]
MHAYAHDHAYSSNRRGVLVTGMPGIGKTVFLLYFLAKTLARKQPVCIHILYQTFAILGPEGTDVYIVPDSSPVLRDPDLYNTLFLIDMDWTGADVPRFMLNKFYQIGASSPNPRLKGLKNWRKQFCIAPIVMNPPDVVDVVNIFRHAYPKSGLTDPQMQNFVRDLIQTFNVDLRRFLLIFDDPQSNRSVSLDREVRGFVRELRAALREMKAEGVVSLIDGSSYSPHHSHRLIATYRRSDEEDGNMRHEVRSPLVVNLLCEAWTNQADKMRTIMEALLSSEMKMAAALGWIFEAEGHTHIVTNQSLNVYPMMETRVGKNKTRLSQHELAQPMEVGQRVMKLYDSASEPSTTCDQKAYYVPMQVNNPLFDSFLVGKGFGAVFQMTRSVTHSFKTKHLKPIQKRLEAICGLPSSGFYFVFVIPTGRKLRINIPDTAATRMFRYYTLSVGSKSMVFQTSDSVKIVLKENGMGGMIGEVEHEDGEYADDGETVDDGDIVMDWI